MASPMLQDVFGGQLVGLDVHATPDVAQKAAIVAAAAGLVGLLSLFNSLGRIFWASMSDFGLAPFHLSRCAFSPALFAHCMTFFASALDDLRKP